MRYRSAGMVMIGILCAAGMCAPLCAAETEAASGQGPAEGEAAEAMQGRIKILESANAYQKVEIDRLIKANKRLLKETPSALTPASTAQREEPLPSAAERPVVPAVPIPSLVVEPPAPVAAAERPSVLAQKAFLRGIAYYGKKEYEKAAAEFEAALDLNANLLAAQRELARSYYAMGAHDKALVQYHLIAAQTPFAVEPYTQMAAIYLAKGRPDEALKVLEDAISLNPTSPSLHEHRGVIYYDLSRYPEAKQEFLEELKIDKQNRRAKRLLKRIELREWREAKRKKKQQ